MRGSITTGYNGSMAVGLDDPSETRSPKFKIGDRVTIVEYPSHDPYHYRRNATVVKIQPGPSYGVLIDGMESMGTHKWYVDEEIMLSDEPQKRTIGPIILAPDIAMLGLGALGAVGSRYMKNKDASMATLMIAAMVGAAGLHGAIMRLTQGALKFEVNYPPPQQRRAPNARGEYGK